MNIYCIYCPVSSPFSSNDGIISLGSHLSHSQSMWVELTPTHGTMSGQLDIPSLEYSDSLRHITQDSQWLNGDTFLELLGKRQSLLGMKM